MSIRRIAQFSLFASLFVVPFGCDKAQPETTSPGEGDEVMHPDGESESETDADSLDPHDFPALDAALQGDGLLGHIHAAVHDTQTYVFTFRKKGNFFDYVDLTLVPRTDEAREALARLRRHDQVRLFGELATFDAPQPHVYLDRVELGEAWAPPKDVPAHDYAANLPGDLPTPDTAIVKIHAIDGDGKVMVVEWRDRVIPVFVDRPELTKDLWRNDKVRLSFDRAGHPDRPMHLVLDTKKDAPIEVLERIEDGHGTPLTLEGKLVLFPDSPQLMFDIYALQVEDADGIRRNYTLVNFEDMDAFQAIRQKLADAWGDAPGVEARNKLVHPTIRIRAEGTKNVVSASQANPQILLSGPDAITILSE